MGNYFFVVEIYRDKQLFTLTFTPSWSIQGNPRKHEENI